MLPQEAVAESGAFAKSKQAAPAALVLACHKKTKKSGTNVLNPDFDLYDLSECFAPQLV